jgi:hypothetical protein
VKYPNDKWWWFTTVYASPIEERRKALWQDLIAIAHQTSEPWMLAGDFNEISSMKEKRGGVRASERRCNNFKDRINSCKLLDMGSVGPKFPWRGPLYHGGQLFLNGLIVPCAMTYGGWIFQMDLSKSLLVWNF